MIEHAGIHLEKDMSVPFGHTVARNVCLFEIWCAPKSVEYAFFFNLYVPQIGSAVKQPIIKAEEDSLNCWRQQFHPTWDHT